MTIEGTSAAEDCTSGCTQQAVFDTGALAPGDVCVAIFAELLLQWAPVDHATTGDTHLGGSSLYLGYRAAI